MNNTTRDELRDEILGYFEQINSHLDSHDSFTDAEMRSNVNEIIALVTAARDAEIRELLLSEGTLNAKFPSMRVEVETKGGQMTAVSIDRHAFLSAALDHIGLHGDEMGGQG